jgi:hypothetical protein
MHRGDTFDLAHLIRENFITCHSYVLDRTRMGRFPVKFAEELSLHEDYAFLLRLCALFRPALPPGPPSCEYRIRDDGTNSILYGGSESAMMGKQRAWSLSTTLKNASKRSIQMLVTEEEFEDETERVRKTTWSIAEEAGRRAAILKEPRFQLVDKANSLVKQRGPRVHNALKFVASKLIKR